MRYLLDMPLPPGPRARVRALHAGWALLIAITGTAVLSVAAAVAVR